MWFTAIFKWRFQTECGNVSKFGLCRDLGKKSYSSYWCFPSKINLISILITLKWDRGRCRWSLMAHLLWVMFDFKVLEKRPFVVTFHISACYFRRSHYIILPYTSLSLCVCLILSLYENHWGLTGIRYTVHSRGSVSQWLHDSAAYTCGCCHPQCPQRPLPS